MDVASLGLGSILEKNIRLRDCDSIEVYKKERTSERGRSIPSRGRVKLGLVARRVNLSTSSWTSLDRRTPYAEMQIGNAMLAHALIFRRKQLLSPRCTMNYQCVFSGVPLMKLQRASKDLFCGVCG